MRTMLVLCVCCMVAACNGSDASNQQNVGNGGKGAVVKLDDLTSRTPASWKEGKASSNLRLFQFLVPKADGDPMDGELVVFFFGKGEGGGIDANLQRWKEKFAPPDGKRIEDVTKIDKFKVGNVGIVYMDVSGTYLFSSPAAAAAKKERRPDHRMIGVIFESPNGPYFITLIGPARTVDQHKKGFDDWLKNFK